MKVCAFSLIVPFYRNVAMLREQLATWANYPSGVSIILVDDGSPEPALQIVQQYAAPELLPRLSLYRIGVDIPWNRGGARNLGTREAVTDWVVHIDIDHILSVKSAENLLEFDAHYQRWYRFDRYRNGRADETRRKDKIADDVTFGKIHPHVDSYLCHRALYWKAGGYNEDFSGCLGGGSPFLQLLEREGPPAMLPDDISLHVYTRDVIKDASDWALPRDRKEFTRRKLKLRKPYRGHNHIRFPWVKQDLCTRG